MIFVDNGEHTDAYFNLALQEYVLRHKMADDDRAFTWISAFTGMTGGFPLSRE